MEKKHVFSLRKSKIGAVSVLLGAVFLFAGGDQVAANDLADDNLTTTEVVTAGEATNYREYTSGVTSNRRY